MRNLLAITAALFMGACADPAPYVPQAAQAQPEAHMVRVSMGESGGVSTVPVTIDGICCFDFIVDSGATDVSVSPELFMAMVSGQHISRANVIGMQTYRTASGAPMEGLTFRMPPMTVGGVTVYDVTASVTKGADVLLLGQTFFRKFKSWSIHNETSELLLSY